MKKICHVAGWSTFIWYSIAEATAKVLFHLHHVMTKTKTRAFTCTLLRSDVVFCFVHATLK